MRDREDYVRYAAVRLMHPANDRDAQKRHAIAARESAEALADELGYGAPTPALEAQGAGEEIRTLALRIEELEDQLAKKTAIARGLGQDLEAARTRVTELEQDLEKATAPKARPR